MQWITVFADASFCPNTRCAGYGAWYKGDLMKSGIVIGGQLPRGLSNSGEAEAFAVCRALQHLWSADVLQPYEGLMLQSDNLRILQLIASLFPKVTINNHSQAAKVSKIEAPILSPAEKEALAGIRTSTASMFVSVRHVKGHKNGEGRQWVNRVCDEKARFYMTLQRSKTKGKPVPQLPFGG